MNILISAYACEPNRGAEPGVGWNLVRELAKKHDLWVLTRADNQQAIEDYPEEWAKNVHWQYVDPPSWITKLKAKTRILRFFYLMWQRSALERAELLAKTVDFDVVHHLTFGTYLVPSLLGALKIPMVLGPVGGGETTPPLLVDTYTFSGKLANFIRDFMRAVVQKWPPSRRRLTNGSTVLAATEQTRIVLEVMGLKDVKLVAQSGVGDDEVDRFAIKHQTWKRSEKPSDEVITLVTASRLIQWKAIDLAIEAVAIAKEQGVKIHLRILQTGSQKKRLEGMVEELGLTDEVTFEGLLGSLEDVYQVITDADALIHPALHEVFGQACVESLALGTPVICIDWCGPGMIVDDATGYKVIPGNRDDTIADLAAAIVDLSNNRGERPQVAEACRDRALKKFHWKRIAAEVNDAYDRAVSQ